MKGRTSYSRAMKVTREIDGIAVELVLQKRTSAAAGAFWWVLSWRTRYSPNGRNRRFYFTRKDGVCTIPAARALEMMEEAESEGALDQEYLDLDRHAGFACDPLVSTKMSSADRKRELESFTGSEEDWGPDPFFVVNPDPNENWKKVLIVNTDDGTAIFRSITEDPDYKPHKTLRPGADWWLDNSMIDANVQQMRVFYSNLRDLSL